MKYISAQPQTIYYAWQVDTMIHSFLKNNVREQDIIILLADEGSDGFNKVIDKYPNVEFLSYPNYSDKNYAPAIKPYLMWQYFKSCKCKSDEQYFYCDADVILTNPLPDFDRSYCYVSDTVSYLGYEYIISKGKEVLDLMCDIVKIDKNIIKNKQEQSGGAQYIFSGTNARFWEKAYKDSLQLFKALSEYNSKNQERYKDTYPIQAWTAEMWATTWAFWKAGIKTKVVSEMDFAWSTDMYQKLKDVKILHNAGVGGNHKQFFKKFEWTRSYPKLDLKVSNKHCSHYYYEQVKEALC